MPAHKEYVGKSNREIKNLITYSYKVQQQFFLIFSLSESVPVQNYPRNIKSVGSCINIWFV